MTIIRDRNDGWAPIYDSRDGAVCRATAPDGSLQPVPSKFFRGYAHMVLPGEPPDDEAILARVGPVDAAADVIVFVPYRPYLPPRRFRVRGQFRSDPGTPNPTWGLFVAEYPIV